MSVSFKGVEVLVKELNKLATLDDVKDVVRLNTGELQKAAQRKVAVDTAALKRSLTPSILDGGFTGRLATNSDYAIPQEYGTRFQSGTPYMRPSLKEQEIKFRKDLQRLMK